MKKLELSLDTLAIESFETGAAPRPEEGTVEAQAAECTAPATCKCATSLYRCGTIHATYSCAPTLLCL